MLEVLFVEFDKNTRIPRLAVHCLHHCTIGPDIKDRLYCHVMLGNANAALIFI